MCVGGRVGEGCIGSPSYGWSPSPLATRPKTSPPEGAQGPSPVRSIRPQFPFFPKGVYLQSDGSLAMIDIDASKGFIALWVHFFVATVGIH